MRRSSERRKSSPKRQTNPNSNKAAAEILVSRFSKGTKDTWPKVTRLTSTHTETGFSQWVRRWAGVWQDPENASHLTAFSVQITVDFLTDTMTVLFNGQNEPRMRKSFAEWLEQFWGGRLEFLQQNGVRVKYALDSLIESSGITLH